MSHALPLQAMCPSPTSRRVTAAPLSWAMGFALAALTLGAPAAAQAPASSPPPPPPAPIQTRAVLRPPTAPPPTAPAQATTRAAAQRPTLAPVVAPGRVSPPPDSMRPVAPAPVATPPANAVAQCADGTFIAAPGDASGCASHGGLRILLPRQPAPPPAVSRAAAAPVASLAAQPSSAAPPLGATMRCKDGTYLGGAPSDAACYGHGGLAAAIVTPRTPPPSPSRPRRP